METEQSKNSTFDLDHPLLNEARDEGIIPFEIFEKNLPPNEDTTCGFWIFKSNTLQKLASKNSYTLLYGIVGCLYSACFAYFNGTATTIEKQIKISSRTTGTIATANNVSQTFINVLLSYYVSKKHNPRWVAIGIIATIFYCLFNLMPYLIYGPGADALSLTRELGKEFVMNYTNPPANNLCMNNRTLTTDCHSSTQGEHNLSKILMLIGNFISGIGGSLISIIGMTFIDDNVDKTDAPAIISFTVFIRLLGPAIGLNLASYCLSFYVIPHLHPLIDKTDPRWIGAWWMGWIVLSVLLLFPTLFMSMYPKILPKAFAKNSYKQYLLSKQGKITVASREKSKPSLGDLKNTIIRLLKNKIYMFNNIAGVFYAFGYTHLMFAPKYMEVQFRISSSQASMTTGTVHLVCQAVGVILCGVLITKFQPKARTLAVWNIGSSMLSIVGILVYSIIRCHENDVALQNTISQNALLATNCNLNSCHCDSISYSPVCGSNNITYISPCHAGCSNRFTFDATTYLYSDCDCINSNENFAMSGACPIDCTTAFRMYLIIIAFNKFLGGTEGASNLLLGIRSIAERDKAVSIGLKLMMFSVLAQIPAPILYGWLVDLTCIVWGKTCHGNGNCWLYDSMKMRKFLNYTSAGCIFIGTLFDVGVWYLAKDIKLFDEIEPAEFSHQVKKVNKETK